jgi:preprotein translocase subunit SecE
VAKQTRQQRRERREAQAAGSPPRGRTPRVRNGGADGGGGGSIPSRPSAPGGGGGHFVSESWAELKKVEWPGQPQLVQGTAVVLIACVIVGIFLWLADLAFKPFVQNVLLGQ